MLLNDDDRRVRDAAATNPSLEPQEDEGVRAEEPPAHSLERIHAMDASKRAEVRMEAAYGPAATPDVLAFLGGERRSNQVRRVVAANPSTPPEVLTSLAYEDDADLLKSIAFNDATPLATLRALANRSIDLAVLVSMNRGSPDSLLEELSGAPESLVRFVAQVGSHTRWGALRDVGGTVPGLEPWNSEAASNSGGSRRRELKGEASASSYLYNPGDAVGVIAP